MRNVGETIPSEWIKREQQHVGWHKKYKLEGKLEEQIREIPRLGNEKRLQGFMEEDCNPDSVRPRHRCEEKGREGRRTREATSRRGGNADAGLASGLRCREWRELSLYRVPRILRLTCTTLPSTDSESRACLLSLCF